jgi:hypothetical protein
VLYIEPPDATSIYLVLRGDGFIIDYEFVSIECVLEYHMSLLIELPFLQRVFKGYEVRVHKLKRDI